MKILAVNSGSSSLKFKLVEFDAGQGRMSAASPSIRAEGVVEEIGPSPRMRFRESGKAEVQIACHAATHAEAMHGVLERLAGERRSRELAWSIEAVGHRVVHGGERFRDPVRIDDAVFAAIDNLTELAPLHNRGCVEGIKGTRTVIGSKIPMVAVFDTGFHRSLPPKAVTYAIDQDLARKHGLYRYGFHGLAHASMAALGAAALGRPLTALRLITLQLGNGCSAAAIEGGRSVDTSMGFTPLEGLVMGTRSGDVDPALVAYLVRHGGFTIEEVERLLNERSGLLGLSGLSHDMREVLLAAEVEPDSRAALAVEVFCYRVRKYIGAYLAALGGADAIVFGGGIGERSALIRARICEGMEWCGIRLDGVRNEAAVGPDPGVVLQIGADGARPACVVAGVDEEIEIARATVDCLQKKPKGNGKGL